MQKILKNKKILILTSVILVLVILIGILSPAVYDTYFSSKTASGMTILNTPIGGLSKEEVEMKVDEEIAKPRTITVVIEDKNIEMDLNSAGFIIDREKTIEEISKNSRKSLFQNLFSKSSDYPINVEVKSDKEQFEAVLDTLLTQEGLSGEAFSFTTEGKTAKININKNVKIVDKGMLFDKICESYNLLATEYKADFKEAELPSAKEIAENINIKAEDARIEKADGKVRVISHKVGISVDEVAIAQKLSNGETQFSVPLTVVNPKIYTDDLGDETFPDLLYKFATTYNEGDVGRSTNVRLATAKIDGQILNNSDIFSFNKVVGQRSYENGYQDANVYLADQVVKDVGGGICQVSSTLYTAVLYSDLKIVERRNHNFTVAYVKAGTDATVSYGSIDFKFQNNFVNPIKIKAVASGGQMVVSIFGTKENNNTVEVSSATLGTTERGTKYIYNASLSPEQSKTIQNGSDGLRVQTYRTVKDSSGKTVRTDNLGISNYVPLVKIVETGDITKVSGGEAPTETPLPSETPSASPSVSPSASPTASPTPSASPAVLESQKPAASKTPIPSPGATATTSPTLAPSASITPEPTEKTEE